MKRQFSHIQQILFYVVVASLSWNVNASEFNGVEYNNLDQMMGSIRLEKKQVESMLDKLILSGRLSVDEGNKAKREIASLKDNDLENIKKTAIADVLRKKELDQ
jgi:methyl coenzyme M reductase gamma subunit